MPKHSLGCNHLLQSFIALKPVKLFDWQAKSSAVIGQTCLNKSLLRLKKKLKVTQILFSLINGGDTTLCECTANESTIFQ